MSSSKDAISAFNKFNDLLEKKVKSKVSLMGFSDIDEYIPTGNYLLNAQLSGSLFGGYPNTRSIGIAGDSGAGKTFLCLNAVRELQNKDYFVFYIDTEGAIDRSDYEKFGVDLAKLKYLRMGLISDVKFFINDFIETMKETTGLKAAIFVDSVGMLDTDKSKRDMDAGKNAADMGLRSKELRAMFKSFTLDLSNLKVPFIFTNHTYASMDQYTPKGMSGGGGPEFSASIILMLSKGTLRDETKTTTGIIVRSKTRKNRLAKPKKIRFDISFNHGMNPYTGLDAFCRPEYFEQIGIAQGKMDVDKKTGEMNFTPGGNRWYVSHLSKSFTTKQLFTQEIFTEEVLKRMEPIVNEYFRYKSLDEIEEIEKQFTEIEEEDDTNGFVDSADADDIFG